MFYDQDCAGGGEITILSRWLISVNKPNTSAHRDLDGDGICEVDAFIAAESNTLTPSSQNWLFYCSQTLQTLTILPVTIDPVPVTGPCDSSAPGKDERTGWCVCAKDSFCADGAGAGETCDPTSSRDRWNPDQVSGSGVLCVVCSVFCRPNWYI
jgi:hypothetical protein